MRTPITPSTPVDYSASATAPLHLDIHIPLVLLGTKKLLPGLTKGPERYKSRLELIHTGLAELVNESGVKIALWLDAPFEERLSDGATDKEIYVFEERKAEWRSAEQERWDAVCQNDGWIIRAMPRYLKASQDSSVPKTSPVEPVGMSNHWRGGDGLLTEREAQLAFSSNLWTLPFTLQRLDLLSSRREDWEREVRVVMDALSRINTLDKSDSWDHRELRRPIAIVATERCHTHVGFRQAASLGDGTTLWDDDAVRNVLLLMTAFEREMTSLATPEFLLMYRPLTDFLVAREVGKMRRARRALWGGLSREIRDGSHDEGGLEGEGWTRKQRHVERKVREWRGEMEREDENVLRRQVLLGEEGTPWWQHLYQEMQESSPEDIVSDITLRTAKKKGRRLALGLSCQDIPLTPTNHNHAQSSPLILEFKSATNPPPKQTPHALTPLSLPPSPIPLTPTPKITTLTFPTPLRSLSPAPLLAYTSLLSSLLHFATENSESDVYAYVRAAKTDAKRARESAVAGLARLAERLGVPEDVAKVLRTEVGGCGKGLEEKRGDAFWEMEGFLSKRYEGGRGAVCGGWNGDGEDGSGKGNRDGKRQVKMGLTFLERYEVVGGFLVPGRVKVLGLLEGLEKWVASEKAKAEAEEKEKEKARETEDEKVKVMATVG